MSYRRAEYPKDFQCSADCRPSVPQVALDAGSGQRDPYVQRDSYEDAPLALTYSFWAPYEAGSAGGAVYSEQVNPAYAYDGGHYHHLNAEGDANTYPGGCKRRASDREERAERDGRKRQSYMPDADMGHTAAWLVSNLAPRGSNDGRVAVSVCPLY